MSWGEKIMEKLSYQELGLLALRELDRPASEGEIWAHIEQNQLYKRLKSYDEEVGLASIGKTPWASVGARLYTEAQKPDGRVKAQGRNPKRFYLHSYGAPLDLDPIPVAETRSRSFHERELHPLLVAFLRGSPLFQASAGTIRHELSKKKGAGANQWLHPDLVAVRFDYADYGENLLALMDKFDRRPLKIYSFEIKKALNSGNYKESFFQAVSNSSWAHEGYLVALAVEEDEDFREALQKLSRSFGIGIIQLDATHVDQSQVLSPARSRESLDYDTIHELAETNSDFQKFLKTVAEYDHREPGRFIREFDTVLEEEALSAHCRDEGIF